VADDPLAGLDDVRWKELSHAYGRAEDTPGLLRRLALGQANDDTWEALFSSLTHQGTVYDASAAAAPFLIRLTQTLSGSDLPCVLAMLESIATAASSPSALIAQHCRLAAERGFEQYVEFLSHADPHVRVFAGNLVASCPRYAARARRALESAIDSEMDRATLAGLLASYDRMVDWGDVDSLARLRRLTRNADGEVAARAAFSLVRGAREMNPDRAWLDAIVRELARPTRSIRALDVRDVLRVAPEFVQPALLDAVCEGAASAGNRFYAFELGHAMLWLAFGGGLGGPARKPRPFVFVESLTFRMPWDTGGGAPKTMEGFPRQIHWRRLDEREPLAEWSCSPFVRTWDFPRPDHWSEPPTSGSLLGVQIAEPLAAVALTPTQHRVVTQLVRWDNFWRTDSDLPMVYGLPARRRHLGVLAGV
jgi:hypothetical protein